MKNRIYAWLALGIITVVAALGLAYTYQITKKPIDDQAVQAEQRAMLAVVPQAEDVVFEEITLEDEQTLLIAKSGEETIGYIGKAVEKGYGGLVEIIVGVQADGTISGINVGGAAFAETPGLGAKAKDAAFTDQFTGKRSPVRIGKPAAADNEVDAITASTITTNAVIRGVNSIARQVGNYLNPKVEAPVVEGLIYAGEAVGFKSPVYVEVSIKDDGTITDLKVGDERFSESAGYGAAALEPAFKEGFLGRQLPLSLDAIDGISGSTVTTQAVVNAINSAYESKNVIGEAGLPQGITYAGEAQGFKSPVYVEVTVSPEGTITGLKVGDERFAESDGYGAAALEADFPEQFIGKTVPLVLEDIDGISGSTVTTQAVVDAINSAVDGNNVVAGGDTIKTPTMTEPSATPAAAEPTPAPEGTLYTGEAQGYAGPVYVQVYVKNDGTISGLTIGDERFEETEGLGTRVLDAAFAERFIGKTLPLAPLQKGDADVIAGVTVTSQAVVNAINAAFAPEQPADTPDDTSAATAKVDSEGIQVSKMGFMAEITVLVNFTEQGEIASFSISKDHFAETPGYGLAALEESFAAGMLGKQPPLSIRVAGESVTNSTVEKIINVDATTSSTATTQAIVDAINEAYERFLTSEQEEKDIYSQQGFMGLVSLRVNFDEDGSILTLEIVKDGFAETPGYGALALEEGFTDQFIGKLPPLAIRKAEEENAPNLVDNLVNLDTNSSATFTMQAIIDAINEAFANMP